MPQTKAVLARDVYLFFALAYAITWALDVPWILACLRHDKPPAYAINLTGLGAFGPTLAAVIVAGWRRELRSVFGRWRTNPVWILAGLALSYPFHIAANLIEIALGGHPAHWFYPPVEPERIAALIVFPLGEEFGWRGFAHARLARLHGLVAGSILLGVLWAFWHLGMMFTPEKGPDLTSIAYMLGMLIPGTLLWSWVFERGGRSMAVALALHVGAHLDNDQRAPESEVRLRLLRVAVFAIGAVFAARALAKMPRDGQAAATG